MVRRDKVLKSLKKVREYFVYFVRLLLSVRLLRSLFIYSVALARAANTVRNRVGFRVKIED